MKTSVRENHGGKNRFSWIHFTLTATLCRPSAFAFSLYIVCFHHCHSLVNCETFRFRFINFSSNFFCILAISTENKSLRSIYQLSLEEFLAFYCYMLIKCVCTFFSHPPSIHTVFAVVYWFDVVWFFTQQICEANKAL